MWQYRYIHFHVKCSLFSTDFDETSDFSAHFLKKYSIMKFHENPSSGSRVILCGRIDRRTDITKLTVAFRIFANSPKSSPLCPKSTFLCFVRISEQTAIISLYSINWRLCITESLYKYNVSINNTTLYFIYNKHSILSGRHVSTFIRPSSGPLSSSICFPRGPEDDPIKVETRRPDNILFLLYIK